MSDLDVLRDLTRQIRPPDFDDLVAVARRRSRRSALGAAAAGVAVVLGVGVAGAVWSGGQRADAPVQDRAPSPTVSSSAAAWPPERVRAEGSPAVGHLGEFGIDTDSTSSGPAVQVYCHGGEPDCDWFGVEPGHWAVEVQQGGRSALFEVDRRPWATVLDDDLVLLVDGPDESPRHRLLRADGTADRLRFLPSPGPARPGPDVLEIPDLKSYREAGGPGGVYRVDVAAGTIQRLDLPRLTWWGPDVRESLWGGVGCRVWWQRADGSVDTKDLGCAPSSVPWSPGLNWDGFEDWATPGRMALVEYGDGADGETVPRVVHVSLDGGDTWQRIPVETADPYAVAGVLGRLG